MSRWFRHYAGMMADPKFGAIARRSKASRAEVLFVWGCILENAAENESSSYEWDADLCADLLNCDTDHAQRIHDEMQRSGLLEDGRVASWDSRQFVSDNSTERSRRHRKNKRNANATLQNVAASPPEAETETDSYTAETRARAIDVRMPELCAALGVTDETKTPGLLSFSEPIQWVTAGCDIDADILPALRTIAARGKTPKSWRYCSDAVFEARDRRLAPPPAVQLRAATGPPRNDLDRMNAALDNLISGQSNEPDLHPRTIDASFERGDWGGSEGAVQRPAIPARN